MRNPTLSKISLPEWRRFVPALGWMAVIFISSSRTGGQLNGWLPWVQQWLPGLASFNPMHYVSYFILGLAVAYGLGRLSATWRGCLLNIVICVVYGLTDEWHQFFVPMRSPDMTDVLHDGMGAAAASLIVLLALKLRRSKNYTSS